MGRTALTLFLLMAFLAIFPARANASGPVYTVNDVKVDILAESAVKARDKAFGEAQKAAFLKLASRFRSAEEVKTLTPPDARTLAGMVQDFELVSEQLSTRRYLGTYTFRFKTTPVNRYFGTPPLYEAPETTRIQRAGLVVLPFFRQGASAPVLWDASRNPWLQAWQKTALDGNPALLLPLGDMSDMMDVKDTQLSSNNQAGIRRMLARYEARDAVIVLARFDSSVRNPLSVEIYRTDRPRLDMLKRLEIENGTSRTLGQLMAKAIAEVRQELEGNWKLETIVQDSPVAIAPEPQTPQVVVDRQVLERAETVKEARQTGGTLTAQVRFATMTEWLSMRRALNAVPSLGAVKIVALKSNEATVALTYGDWASLSRELVANGLFLQSNGVGGYFLSNRPSSAIY